MTGLATTLQAFFTDRLVRQRQVSANTIQAYRDTLRLLLVFASERQGKSPVRLDIDDLDAPLIGCTHPKRPAGRNPFPVPLCSPAPSRTCRHHRTHSRNTAEAL